MDPKISAQASALVQSQNNTLGRAFHKSNHYIVLIAKPVTGMGEGGCSQGMHIKRCTCIINRRTEKYERRSS